MHTIYAIAGGPAAGKTTYRLKALNEGLLPQDAFLHDCDAVMHSLPGYQEDLLKHGSSAAFAAWERRARELAIAQLQTQVQNLADIIYDRSCALPSCHEFLRTLVEQRNYKLIMHVLYVSPAEAKLRALKREIETGRHIPENIILERTIEFSKLWPSYLQLATEAYLYNNNSLRHESIACYKNSKLTVQDHKSYAEFLDLQKICVI